MSAATTTRSHDRTTSSTRQRRHGTRRPSEAARYAAAVTDVDVVFGRTVVTSQAEFHDALRRGADGIIIDAPPSRRVSVSGAGKIQVVGRSQVIAHDTDVDVHDTACAIVSGTSFVTAVGRARIELPPSCLTSAVGRLIVTATDRTTVTVRRHARIGASDHAQITTHRPGPHARAQTQRARTPRLEDTATGRRIAARLAASTDVLVLADTNAAVHVLRSAVVELSGAAGLHAPEHAAGPLDTDVIEDLYGLCPCNDPVFGTGGCVCGRYLTSRFYAVELEAAR